MTGALSSVEDVPVKTLCCLVAVLRYLVAVLLRRPRV